MFFFFFLMIPLPPRSTLFPYTTLSDLVILERAIGFGCSHDVSAAIAAWIETVADGAALRSEEHTSELQSHSDLVCRLLLEKKKKITTDSEIYNIRRCDTNTHHHQ